MAFVGLGQNDSGGQAQPAFGTQGIIFATAVGFPVGVLFLCQRGPTNSGILYQTSGSVFSGGFGQIFPTGRT